MNCARQCHKYCTGRHHSCSTPWPCGRHTACMIALRPSTIWNSQVSWGAARGVSRFLNERCCRCPSYRCLPCPGGMTQGDMSPQEAVEVQVCIRSLICATHRAFDRLPADGLCPRPRRARSSPEVASIPGRLPTRSRPASNVDPGTWGSFYQLTEVARASSSMY